MMVVIYIEVVTTLYVVEATFNRNVETYSEIFVHNKGPPYILRENSLMKAEVRMPEMIYGKHKEIHSL